MFSQSISCYNPKRNLHSNVFIQWPERTNKLRLQEAKLIPIIFNFKGIAICLESGRRSGLMVSVLIPGANSLGSSPGRGHGVVFFKARRLTLTVPLSTQEYKWVLANCSGNLTNCWGSDLPWTSIPCRGSRNTPSRLMLQKPG